MRSRPVQQDRSRGLALLVGLLIALLNASAAADELTDALAHYAKLDYARALEKLTPLAEQGNAVAQVKLGIIYSRAEGVPRDDAAALRWLTRAAEQGEPEAQFELGVMYRDGLGTPTDGKLAMQWFQRAAERGVPHAFNALGELYLGHPEIPQDYAAALVWFLRGAQLDDADCLYNIGIRYALGQGVEQDEIEAYKWLDLATNISIGGLHSKAVRALQAIGERLMPLQIAQAKSGAQEWLRAHRSAPATLEALLRGSQPAADAALARPERME
jgi:TPR repeat protein